MGLARELTMGTSGTRRRRGAGRFPLASEFTRLRELTKRVGTVRMTADDLNEINRLVVAVAALPQRLRFEEGAILNAACSAYKRATGVSIGPETGVL